MRCLRNNLLLWFWEPASWARSPLKCYPESTMLFMEWKIVCLRFWDPGFLHLPSDWRWHLFCTSGLTTNKLEYRQVKKKALVIKISYHGWFITTLRCWAFCSHEWYSGRERCSTMAVSCITPALVSISHNAGTAVSARNDPAVNFRKNRKKSCTKSSRNWYSSCK